MHSKQPHLTLCGMRGPLVCIAGKRYDCSMKNPEDMTLNEKLQAHLATVRMHRSLVRKNLFACGLYRQGLMHDITKYSPQELIPSVKYFQGWRSPYMQEKAEKGYSLGWLHHKGHNRHHWEYWYDMINGTWTPIPMPYEFVVEMLCDRVAACRTYLKEKYTRRSALEYYQSRNDRLYMHPDTRKQLEIFLYMTAEYGEEITFRLIRNSIRDRKHISEFPPDLHLSEEQIVDNVVMR